MKDNLNLGKIKKYYNYFIGNKLLMISLISLYFYIYVIAYNCFCESSNLKNFRFDPNAFINNISIEIILSFIYTYIGNILMMFFLNKDKYKKIAIICFPITIIALIMNNCINSGIATIVITIIYFLYSYIESPTICSIIKTFGLMMIIVVIQIVFYFFKYSLLNINYADVRNEIGRFLLSFDYYLFLWASIIVKNRIVRR